MTKAEIKEILIKLANEYNQKYPGLVSNKTIEEGTNLLENEPNLNENKIRELVASRLANEIELKETTIKANSYLTEVIDDIGLAR